MLGDSFRQAVERDDIASLAGLFAENATFRSPAVFEAYEGREPILLLLDTVSQVFEGFHYTDQVESGDTAVLAFSATVGDRALDGIDLLRFDADGKIRELVVYVRPLSGLTALAEEMGRSLAAGETQASG